MFDADKAREEGFENAAVVFEAFTFGLDMGHYRFRRNKDLRFSPREVETCETGSMILRR